MSNTVRPVALVTGSATGIGKAVALRFAREGFAVAINYTRSEKEAQDTLAQIRELRVPALLCRASVAEEAAVRDMVRRCRDELGGLDVLVNNAGITRRVESKDLEGLSDEVWEDILRVNLMGTFFCARAALPLLRQRKGCIVNITSVAGLIGQGSSIPYAVSKAAVNCLTKALARAFGPEVRVNAVAPGPVLTRWVEGHRDKVIQAMQAVPMGRPALPEDVADLVYFLAGGTTLLTGQVVVLDGGRTIL
jgi:3-oxoacyl-[acyl-carrier protein] reductase